MGNATSAMDAKDFAASLKPVIVKDTGELMPTESLIIFNVGVVQAVSAGLSPTISLTLTADGYAPQFGQTTCVGMATSSMVQKGFTFALDKNRLESAVLTLRVVGSSAQMLERAIPVRTLKYSGQRFFNETVSFGMLQGIDKNTKSVPVVKLAFELLAVGDGRVHVPKQPHYMDLELAGAGSFGVAAHPLGAVA
jgi:hypothetical protein